MNANKIKNTKHLIGWSQYEWNMLEYIYDVKQPRIHDHSVLVYILVYDKQKP